MRVWGAVLAAIALFSLLFAGITFHFWGQLAISTFALACLAIALDHSILERLRKWDGLSTLIWGLLSAGALYAAFFGAALAVKHILPVGSSQITQVYSLKEHAPAPIIALLLVFVIGPCEEIFWRGYVQRTFSEKHGCWIGLCLTTLLYGGAHLASGKFMLVIAALVCGVFWGFLYNTRKSLWTCILSHAIWDVLVFLIAPLPA